MRKIKRTSALDTVVGYVQISSTALLDEIKSFTDKDIKATVEEFWDSYQYEFDSMSDLRRHLELIRTPLRIYVGSVQLVIPKSEKAYIRYESDEDSPVVETLKHRLEAYRRKSEWLYSDAVILFLCIFPVLLTFYFLYPMESFEVVLLCLFFFVFDSFIILPPLLRKRRVLYTNDISMEKNQNVRSNVLCVNKYFVVPLTVAIAGTVIGGLVNMIITGR